MHTEDLLTTVSVSWRQKKRNHRLLFGTPLSWVRLGWRRRLAVFNEGQVFGYERWSSGRHGTLQWNVFVLQAGGSGDILSVVRGVRPGARILLSAYGTDRAGRALHQFDCMRSECALEEITPERWSVLGGRFLAGMPLVETGGRS